MAPESPERERQQQGDRRKQQQALSGIEEQPTQPREERCRESDVLVSERQGISKPCDVVHDRRHDPRHRASRGAERRTKPVLPPGYDRQQGQQEQALRAHEHRRAHRKPRRPGATGKQPLDGDHEAQGGQWFREEFLAVGQHECSRNGPSRHEQGRSAACPDPPCK